MKKLTLTLLAILISIPALAQAPARIAVIDVSRVVEESAVGKATNAVLTGVQQNHMTRLASLEEEVKKLEQDYQQKRLSLSETNLAAMEKQISEKQLALQRYGQDAQRDLQARRKEAMEELNDKIMPIVEEVGKEMGFAAIFNKYGSGLVYASDAVDITSVIVQRVDQRVPAN